VLTWLHFLAERRGGKGAWQADHEDVAAYHAARRRSEPPHRITAASWNRAVAALEKLYGWAVDEGIVATSPFRHSVAWRRIGHGLAPVRISRARERAARTGDPRFIDVERYMQFRDVGLRGRLPDGTDDPAWRGRHGERNALFAELLVTTGLRLEEAGSLLTGELPRSAIIRGDRRPRRSIPFRVPASIAKGNKAREVRLPLRLLRQLGDYIELERANMLERGRREQRSGAIVVAAIERDAAILDEGDRGIRRVRLDLLTPAERRRLVVHGDDGARAATLWIGETGQPMTSGAWQVIFHRASERCRFLGLDIEVTPHMLRHTFAVHMLALLLREQIGTVLRDGPGADDQPGAGVYRRLIGDPLQKLQRLMGHASIASTHIYLDSLEECRALVDAATERWAAELGEPESCG
jgi:site-specific recombinase XerD